MNNEIKTILTPPEGYEYGGFNEETREVVWKPKVKPLGRIERTRDFRYITTSGNIIQWAVTDSREWDDHVAFGNYFPTNTVPYEEVEILRDYWRVVMKIRRIEGELNPEGWKPGRVIRNKDNCIHYAVVYDIRASKWTAMGAGIRVGLYLGQFHSCEAARQCLDALDDNERRALLRFWKVSL